MKLLVNDRTKLLMPVHLYGYMADMEPIMAVAADAGIAVAEDAAQSVGALYHGRPAGSFGLGCFSLYTTKNVTTGEGGVVTTTTMPLPLTCGCCGTRACGSVTCTRLPATTTG